MEQRTRSSERRRRYFSVESDTLGTLRVSGAISFANAARALAHAPQAPRSGSAVDIDLGALENADSATLAVLIAWSARAQAQWRRRCATCARRRACAIWRDYATSRSCSACVARLGQRTPHVGSSMTARAGLLARPGLPSQAISSCSACPSGLLLFVLLLLLEQRIDRRRPPRPAATGSLPSADCRGRSCTGGAGGTRRDRTRRDRRRLRAGPRHRSRSSAA